MKDINTFLSIHTEFSAVTTSVDQDVRVEEMKFS